MMFYAKMTRGRFLNRVLREDLFVQAFALKLKLQHVFYENFDKAIKKLINYYFKNVTEDLNMKQYEHLYVEEPQVLTLEELEAGFVLWIFAISFATIVFIIEWLKRFIDFLVFKSVINAFFVHQEHVEWRSYLRQRYFLSVEEKWNLDEILTSLSK